MSKIIIFDLDGVITSEEAYWTTGGLVIHEALYSPRYWNISKSQQEYQPVVGADGSLALSRRIFPRELILDMKARSINSNWDTTFVGFSLYLITLLARLPDKKVLLPLEPWQAEWIAALRQQLALLEQPIEIDPHELRVFDLPIFRGYRGQELIDRLNAYASALLGIEIEGVFERYSPSWKFCRDLFQEWYLGETLYTQAYQHPPRQPGKAGCIHFEQPLLPVEQLKQTLTAVQEQGYLLGIATGRPGYEATDPLKHYGLYSYFDEARIITDREVAQAEAELRQAGKTLSLIKPHPYPFLKAAYPVYSVGQELPERGSFIVVGDTPSDVGGARAAGAISIAVLSGARTAEARALLEQSQPDFLLEDVTHVPALLKSIDDLATIQKLQFSQKGQAELLLQRWFALHMDLHVDSVTLTPKAVSLNSFNGFYRSGSEEYFFKTHVEEQGVVEEYYHAERLHQAGYNIVRPLRTLHEQGQQMVIYPVVRDPVMFDLMRAVENGDSSQASMEMLLEAERRECQRLLQIYRQTLADSTAEEHAQAPVHQLFWHRLTGGRLDSFYQGREVPLPESDTTVSFEELATMQWVINGRAITGELSTLAALIERAKSVLNPHRAATTVVGHGDAHFGNVFLQNERDYCYFDPAFAGRHSPLLDIVKPLFHNVFATWMYFPHEVAQSLRMQVQINNGRIVVEHNYQLTAVRRRLLDIKMTQLLPPLLALLREREALPEDWQEIVQLALVCCPLLTVPLLDLQRRPLTTGWLGFVQAVEMGHLLKSGEWS